MCAFRARRKAEHRPSVRANVNSWFYCPLCTACVCISSLNVLTDLPLQAVPPFLQLLDGAVLRKLVGSASHLALSHAAREQLLVRTEVRKIGGSRETENCVNISEAPTNSKPVGFLHSQKFLKDFS